MILNGILTVDLEQAGCQEDRRKGEVVGGIAGDKDRGNTIGKRKFLGSSENTRLVQHQPCCWYSDNGIEKLHGQVAPGSPESIVSIRNMSLLTRWSKFVPFIQARAGVMNKAGGNETRVRQPTGITTLVSIRLDC